MLKQPWIQKELKKKVSMSKEESSSEVLVTRGRSGKKNNCRKNHSWSKSKSKGNNKCFNWNKKEYYMRNCPNHKGLKKNWTSNSSDGTIVKEKLDIVDYWI